MPELYNSTGKTQSKTEPDSIDPGVEPMKPQEAKPEPESIIKKHQHHDFRKILKQEKPSTNPLAAFMVFPKKVKVEIQDPQEEILLLLRRHFLTNTKWIIVAIIMLLAPLLLTFVPLIEPLPYRFQLMTLVIWYLITTGFIIESFLSWYFNVYIITDERVIDIDFLNLLYKNIGAAKLENIEEINTKTVGAIRSVFNYGTVFIQTAGESPQIEFEAVPQPQKVAKLLNELILEEEQEKIEGRIR